jgi:hypothetical protein
MSSKNQDNTIGEFYIACQGFCSQLENTANISKGHFIRSIHKLLSLIYLKASLIKKPDTPDEEEAEKFVREFDYIYIKESISAKLGSADKYIEIVLPENADPENFEAITLSECIADIYQDLRNFASNYELGNEEAVIVSLYECMDNFEKFWGVRVLSAIIAMHNRIYAEVFSDDDQTEGNKNERTNNPDSMNWIN